MRWRCRIALASSSEVPSGAVISPSEVMYSRTGASKSVAKRTSRLVRMPTSLPPSVIGTPAMW